MSETNFSYRSTYSSLNNTWCGKGSPPIPQKPNDTFNPPAHFSNHCPADWDNLNYYVPFMSTQIVLDSQNLGYNSLTHNVEPSASNYFSYLPAYNNDVNGYTPKFRTCDGSFVKISNPVKLSAVIPQK